MEGHQLHHYRDKDKKEVDFIITARNGISIAIEVKAGMTIKRSMFKTIDFLLSTGAVTHGIIIYTGDKILPLSDTLTAVPVSVLFS